MILRHASERDLKTVKAIYKEAFPFIEKKPWLLLKKWIKDGKYDLLVGIDNNDIAGFLITVPYKDIILLDYLAVNPDVRSKGYGSMILELAEKHYEGMRLVLVAEVPDDNAENKDQRIARMSFYKKNGWVTTDMVSVATSGQLQILTKGEITEDEYLQVNLHALGDTLFRLSKMHVVPLDKLQR